MGIESDQVVFEYLSRVGDLAQQRQLPSATRMRLVAELRNEIDRSRAKTPVDSPTAVRRILARLGAPDEVVAAAGGSEDGTAPEEPRAAVPVQRASEPEDRPKGLRWVVPRPRPADPRPVQAPDDGPTPPHLAGLDELGDSVTVQPDWWRVDGNSPARPQGGPHGSNVDLGDSVPGFVGGVEIPELLKPPQEKTPQSGAPERKEGAPGLKKTEKTKKAEKTETGETGETGDKAETGEKKGGAETEPAVGRTRRRALPRLRPGGGWTNPLLLLAAALLAAGAVVGSLIPLALGWLIAYLSRRLTPNESKWAVLGVPGTVAAAWIVWLWGRTDGRWGAPIAQRHMNEAITDTWPWALRTAAVTSALYLLWRSQRPRR